MAEIRGSFPNVSMKKKAILVGVLTAAAKDSNLIGKTVQLSLSSQARKTFDRYRFDRTFKVQQGKVTREGSEVISVKAEARKNGKNNYTLLIIGEAGA
jgi:hypothetical protein